MMTIDQAGTYSFAGHDVKRLGYGAMQLAGPGVFGPPRDQEAALAVLRAAVEAGVNHIDTSDFYGPHVTNRLIRDGATLLMSARDVLDALGSEAPRQASFFEPDPPPLPLRDAGAADMRQLLELLSPNPIDTDDLARESGIDAATLSALLLELSLAGRITRHADGSVSLA